MPNQPPVAQPMAQPVGPIQMAQAVGPSVGPPMGNMSVADQLTNLANLHATGAIDAAQFEAAKMQVLGVGACCCGVTTQQTMTTTTTTSYGGAPIMGQPMGGGQVPMAMAMAVPAHQSV